MTNNIYPPDHLLKKWEELIIDEEQNVDLVLYEAFQAGADQELEACCHLLRQQGFDVVDDLRATRRPKPLSLKQQALATLEEEPDDGKELLVFDTAQVNIIRRALEQLDD
jgi:hypothetical protein